MPLTDEDVRTLEAAMDRVLPSGASPGARSARAASFAARVFAGDAFSTERALIASGLQGLDADARRTAHRSYADSPAAIQDDLLQRHARSAPDGDRFIRLLIRLTLAGFLSAPKYGGNHEGQGWM